MSYEGARGKDIWPPLLYINYEASWVGKGRTAPAPTGSWCCVAPLLCVAPGRRPRTALTGPGRSPGVQPERGTIECIRRGDTAAPSVLCVPVSYTHLTLPTIYSV